MLLRGTKSRVGGKRSDHDLLGRRPVELDEVALRALGDGEHARGLPHRAADEELEGQ